MALSGREVIWGSCRRNQLLQDMWQTGRGGTFREEGNSPDGFPPSLSLLRLILPDQSLMPAVSTLHASGAQVSSIPPRI